MNINHLFVPSAKKKNHLFVCRINSLYKNAPSYNVITFVHVQFRHALATQIHSIMPRCSRQSAPRYEKYIHAPKSYNFKNIKTRLTQKGGHSMKSLADIINAPYIKEQIIYLLSLLFLFSCFHMQMVFKTFKGQKNCYRFTLVVVFYFLLWTKFLSKKLVWIETPQIFTKNLTLITIYFKNPTTKFHIFYILNTHVKFHSNKILFTI